jgi:uncharacterized protein
LKNALGVLAAVMLSAALGSAALASDTRAEKLNQGAVGLLASQGYLLDDALQIANAVDHIEGLRVLPVVGRGGMQSINDLLFLRGIDVALLCSDTLAFAKKNKLYADETAKISYLAKIGNENIIIVARSEFTTLESLAGKRIGVGRTDSDEFVAADLVLGSLNPGFEPVASSGKPAVEALLSGRLDAVMFSGTSAYADLTAIKANRGLHILPIALNDNLGDTYSPAILSSTDVPNLIPAGTVVETVASSLVLAVFDWPQKSERYYKLEKFNRALLASYSASLNKERATNFLAAVPGWKPYLTGKQTGGATPLPQLTTTALQ